MKVNVFTAVINHKFGTNLYMSLSEEDLYAKLYDYVSNEWVFNYEMPDNHQKAVKDYFDNNHDSETLELDNSILFIPKKITDINGKTWLLKMITQK